MPRGQQRKDTLDVKDAGRVGPDFSTRAKRAMGRAVEKLGPDYFRVEGRTEEWHYVDPTAMTPCHCGDHCWRGRDCIHMLAVRLYQEGIHPSAKGGR